MKCLSPVRMYRTDSGLYTHSPNGVNVLSDLFRPCARCMNCRLSKATDWAIRMSHEAQFHPCSSFLTLTYAPDKLPLGGSLNYDDVVNFIKRLRRRLDSTPHKSSLSFYRVGEYGDAFSRPHYHMILFGYDFSEPIKYKGVVNELKVSSSKDDRYYFKSTFATDCWSHGFVDIGSVDFNTCQYVSKYVTKKLFGAQASAYGSLLPEKASMSKKNPIGKRWIERYYSDVYPHDYVVIKGKKYPPPKFYDRWLEQNHPSLYTKVKQSREDSIESSFPDVRELHAAQTRRLQKQAMYTRDGVLPNSLNDKHQLDRKQQLLDELKDIL